jgi:hypothetical protein
MGGAPGADPMMGGMGGGPPMGGDMGGMGAPPPPATPVPIQNISIADVWKVLRRVADDQKYNEFFNEISVSKRNPKLNKVAKVEQKPKSLLK